MPDQVKQIAQRLRELRMISGLTEVDVAESLGVTEEEYITFESGDVDIPIGFLYDAAHKYNVELTAILTGEDPKLHSYCLVRNGKGVNVDRRNPYKYQSLAYNFIQKKAEPFLVEVTPNEVESPVHLSSHANQEFNYVIEGTLMIYLDGHQLILNEGDSLYFDSSLSHGMKALNGKKAKFLEIIF